MFEFCFKFFLMKLSDQIFTRSVYTLCVRSHYNTVVRTKSSERVSQSGEDRSTLWGEGERAHEKKKKTRVNTIILRVKKKSRGKYNNDSPSKMRNILRRRKHKIENNNNNSILNVNTITRTSTERYTFSFRIPQRSSYTGCVRRRVL